MGVCLFYTDGSGLAGLRESRRQAMPAKTALVGGLLKAFCQQLHAVAGDFAAFAHQAKDVDNVVVVDSTESHGLFKRGLVANSLAQLCKGEAKQAAKAKYFAVKHKLEKRQYTAKEHLVKAVHQKH